MSRFLTKVVRPWVAEELFDTALRNPQRIFRQLEREMNAMERHFDQHFFQDTPSNRWQNRGYQQETQLDRFYDSNEYNDLVSKYNKEYADIKSNYVKQLNQLRETYQKQSQELFDKQVAEAEKAEQKDTINVDSLNQGNQLSAENARVHEKVHRHYRNINGKEVEEIVTTKFFKDGSREVHEVTRDEQGTREKTTRYEGNEQQKKLEAEGAKATTQ